MVCTYARASLFVANIDRALPWYEAVFDMTPRLDTPMTLPGPLLPGGEAGDALRLLTLEQRAGGGEPIALLQWMNAERRAHPPQTAAIHVVHSDDAGALLQRAIEKGSRVQSGYVQWDADLPDGARVRLGACSFWDLDHHLYEVLEPPKPL